jgi:hypothetical protein
VELPGVDLGTPTLIQVLQSQQADGVLMRTQITLPDPTLQGLLGLEAVPCPLSWDHMVR